MNESSCVRILLVKNRSHNKGAPVRLYKEKHMINQNGENPSHENGLPLKTSTVGRK